MASLPQSDRLEILQRDGSVVAAAISTVKRSAKRLIVSRGIAAFVAATLGTALLLGLADYLFHFPDRGLRALATLTLVACAVWSVRRFVVPAVRCSFDEIAVAQRIEHRFPYLRGRLANALSFVVDPDGRLNREELRQAVVRHAAASLDRVDLRSCLDRRHATRSLTCALTVVGLAFLAGILDTRSALIAAKRLAMPWSHTAWSVSPQSTEPYTITQLRTTVHPPDYTGIEPYEHAGGPIRVPHGSSLSFAGELNQPAASVRWNASDAAEPVLTTSDSPGTSFTLAQTTILVQTGEFWFEITDAAGHEVSVRETPFDVVADRRPSVAIASPSDMASYTEDAAVVVTIEAEDDLALRSVRLHVNDRVIDLLQAGVTPPSRRPSTPPDRETLSCNLQLTDLDVAPGDEIELLATASDYSPQETRSETRTLIIVGVDDLSAQLSERLRTALRAQRQARQRLDAPPTGADAAVSSLRQVQLEQQQVRRLLTDEPDGAAAILKRLPMSVRDTERVRTTERELRRLTQSVLPSLETGLARLVNRDAEQPPAGRSGEITVLQDEVISTLERLVESQDAWSDYRATSDEFTRLLQEQQRVRQATGNLTTAGKAVSELTDEQRAGLAALAEDQRTLATHARRAESALTTLMQETGDDPVLSQQLTAIAMRLAEAGLADGMRRASSDIEQNRVGRAATTQASLEQALRDVVELLSRESTPVQANADELRNFRREVRRLLTEQIALSTETSALGDERPLLAAAERQTALATRTGDLAASVENARAFVLALSQSQIAMNSAAGRLRASQRKLAIDDQQRAISSLQQLLAAVSTGAKPEEPGQSGGEPRQPGQTGKPHALAQLRLVRTMQAEVNEQTSTLHDQQRADGLDAESTDRIAMLVDRERELAAIVTELVGEPSPSDAEPTEASSAGDDSLANQLLDDLSADSSPPLNQQPSNGEDVGGDPTDALLRAAATRMQTVADRLRKRQIAQLTQQMQDTILRDLDQVLEQFGEQSSQTQAQAKPAGSNAGTETGQASTTPGGATNVDDPNTTTVDPRTLIDDVWGRLPEQVRRELPNVSPDKFLPEYEQVTRDYFLRLLREQQERRP